MTIARIDLPDPTYQRAWSVANASERATLLSSGDPRRGDIIHQIDTTVYYVVVETSIIQQLSGFAALPIDLATGVTGALADTHLTSNVPLKDVANIFTKRQTISYVHPALSLIDTSEAADLKRFQFRNEAQLLKLDTVNDAGTVLLSPIIVNRAGDVTTGRYLSVIGGQVTFPATQIPSANANTLDDYREGNWTPVDNSGAGLTFVSTTGNYIKIGRTVFIDGQVNFPVTANGNAVSFGGLPYAVAGGNAPLTIGYNSSAVAAAAYAAVFTTQIQIVLNPGSGVGVTNAQLSGKILVFGGFYRT